MQVDRSGNLFTFPGVTLNARETGISIIVVLLVVCTDNIIYQVLFVTNLKIDSFPIVTSMTFLPITKFTVSELSSNAFFIGSEPRTRRVTPITISSGAKKCCQLKIIPNFVYVIRFLDGRHI